jgi:glycosyltransferase involved in cell wall biosynthesis
MHIGFIIYGSLDTLTGGYLYDRYLVQHLMAQGHSVEIISLRVRPYMYRLLDNFSKKTHDRLLTSSVDVLLQDELCHPSLLRLNERMDGHNGTPIVSIVHQVLCDEPREKWLNFLFSVMERKYLSSVNAFIFNSEATRKTVWQLTREDRPGVVAYPAGNRLGSCRSFSDLKGRTHQGGPLNLLFLGNVIPRKGLIPLLEVLAKIPREKWRLDVVGSLEINRAYVHRSKKLIKNKKLSKQVHFHGALRALKLTDIISKSHLLFMPYSYEGFGIVYMEGMAFGLPAVGSRLGAAREMISHGSNGFLAAPDDAASIGDIIEKLYRNRDLLFQMSMAALERFESHPTWKDSMTLIEKFLMELAR